MKTTPRAKADPEHELAKWLDDNSDAPLEVRKAVEVALSFFQDNTLRRNLELKRRKVWKKKR